MSWSFLGERRASRLTESKVMPRYSRVAVDRPSILSSASGMPRVLQRVVSEWS